jgi:hypothetical protein
MSEAHRITDIGYDPMDRVHEAKDRENIATAKLLGVALLVCTLIASLIIYLNPVI